MVGVITAVTSERIGGMTTVNVVIVKELLTFERKMQCVAPGLLGQCLEIAKGSHPKFVKDQTVLLERLNLPVCG